MAHYLIESTVCMAVLYGFYHVLLRQLNIFRFNRCYLLLSVAFSLMIPLVTIPTSLPIPSVFYWTTLQQTSESENNPEQSSYTVSTSLVPSTDPGSSLHNTPTEAVLPQAREAYNANRIPLTNILWILYGLTTSMLLIRYLLNIGLMIRRIRNSPRAIEYPWVVLVKQEILPYSFAGHIFVNQREYEQGQIDRRLIAHEQAHCAGLHTADILFMEALIIVMWFNPFLWLFRRAIRLNHEFLADHSVLSAYDLDGYKETLFQLVCRNNAGYLASNFNISLTKNRLIMMTRNHSPKSPWLRKLATAPLFMLLTVMLTFSQKANPVETPIQQTVPGKTAPAAPVVLRDKAPASSPAPAPKTSPIVEEDKTQVSASSVYSMSFPKVTEDPNGASQELLNEYHAILEKFMVRADTPDAQRQTGGKIMTLSISYKNGSKASYIFDAERLTRFELSRLEFIFGKMSQAQKAMYTYIGIPTQGKVIKQNEPSPELLENLKKRGDVQLYIDDKKVSPEVLNAYKSSDFSSAFNVLQHSKKLYMSLIASDSVSRSDSVSVHLQTNEYYRERYSPADQKSSYTFGIPVLVNDPSVKEVSAR